MKISCFRKPWSPGWWWRGWETKTSTAPSSNYRRGNTLLCGTVGKSWHYLVLEDTLTTKSLASIHRPGRQLQQTLSPGISPAQQLRETWGKHAAPHPPARFPRTLTTEWWLSQRCSGRITLLMFLCHSQAHVHQRHSSSLHEIRMGRCAPSISELTHWKRPNAGRDWGQEEQGTTEDGWLDGITIDGHEFG